MADNKKMTARIIKDIGIIHRFETPYKYEIGKTGVTVDLQYQAWPSVTVDENGVIYAFISGRLRHIDPFGQTLMYKSYDNGETWSDPIVVNDTPMDDRDVGVAYLGNGKMLITYFRISAWGLMTNEQEITTADGITIRGTRPATRNERGNYVDGYVGWQNDVVTTQEQRDAVFSFWQTMTKKELDGGCWCLTSEDYGETWSAPMPTCNSTPHGPIALRNGQLLYVGRGSVAGVGGDGIYAFTSDDFGKSWQYKSQIYESSVLTFCEPHVVELESGRLVVGIRVQMNNVKIDGIEYKAIGFDKRGLPLHKREVNGETKFYHISEERKVIECDEVPPYTGYRLYTCYSDDGGKTWTKPRVVIANNPTGLTETAGQPYGTPPHLLQLKNGAIVMTYATRNFDIGERAIISYDEGETWDEEIVLCNKPYDAEPDKVYKYKHGDIGYPATAVLADGSLISVYYQAYTDDHYCSFLFTKWALEE